MGRKTRKQQKRTRRGRGRTIRRKSSVRAKKMVGGFSQFKSLLKDELEKLSIDTTGYSSYTNEDLVSKYGVYSIGIDPITVHNSIFLGRYTLDQKKGVAWWRAVDGCKDEDEKNRNEFCSKEIPIVPSRVFIPRSDAMYDDSDGSIGWDDHRSEPEEDIRDLL